MTRKTIKIQAATAGRFERFARPEETQTETVARLLDIADVPEVVTCSECGDVIDWHVVTPDGRTLCMGCNPHSGVDA